MVVGNVFDGGLVMKIVDKTINEIKVFKDLKLEDIFRWDGRLFMKVSTYYDNSGSVNAYDFDKHRLTDFTCDTKVEVISAELILYKKGWSKE